MSQQPNERPYSKARYIKDAVLLVPHTIITLHKLKKESAAATAEFAPGHQCPKRTLRDRVTSTFRKDI